MYKAGCRAMWFGVESGSQRILNLLQKDITIDQVTKAFALCKKIGIKTGASFMIGIPGETKEDMSKTFELAHQIDANWPWFSSFQCRPGSELHDKVIREKLFERIDENGVALIKTKDFYYSEIPRIKGRLYLKFCLRKPQRLVTNFIDTPNRVWKRFVKNAKTVAKGS